jgi:anti-sigma factor RsiW
MTMHESDHHPSDEILAALAGDDAEARADQALAAHVASCARCHGLVAELASLRAALSDLPDIAPSRPLQLVPPVPEPAPRKGWLSNLRGLAAPAMLAGAGLMLVGAVGLGGLVAGGTAGGAAQPAAQEDTGTRGLVDGASPVPNRFATQVPSASGAGEDFSQPPATSADDAPGALPWLILVLAGGGLLIAGLVLRFSINPRAG